MSSVTRSKLSSTLTPWVMTTFVVLSLAVSTLNGGVAHAATGNFPAQGRLDCNGYSTIQKPSMPYLQCPDFVGYDGGPGLDNGHYIGHDEPTVQFLSNAPGSGHNVKWEFTLPKERPLPAIQSFENYFQFWFGMTLCDPNSFPQNPCIPDSDANPAPRFAGDPASAGSAFLELQFYPPGAVEAAGLSCDLTRWCAGLVTASFECNSNFTFCNPGCQEPVNFAYIQRDGIPTAPANPSSGIPIMPNAHTLYMNQGDKIEITMHDTPNGIINHIEDKTTGKSGFMVASAANGFENTNLQTCATTPFSFHPEFGTARYGNFVPWVPFQVNIGFAMEIGHFTPGATGDNDADDAPCVPGPLVAGCYDFAQAGDLDFDGSSYLPDWADGTSNTPTSIKISSALGNGIGPVSSPDGKHDYDHPYSTLQFETAVIVAEVRAGTCNLTTLVGCQVPPVGAAFYPFYSQAGFGKHCVLMFGNDIRGATVNDFGRDAQYGTQNPAWSLGGLISGILRNPCIPRN